MVEVAPGGRIRSEMLRVLSLAKKRQRDREESALGLIEDKSELGDATSFIDSVVTDARTHTRTTTPR